MDSNILYIIDTSCLMEYHLQTVQTLKRQGVTVVLFAVDMSTVLNKSIVDFYRKQEFKVSDFSEYFGPDTYLTEKGRLQDYILTNGTYDPSKWAGKEKFQEGIRRIKTGWLAGCKMAIVHSSTSLFEQAVAKTDIRGRIVPRLQVGEKITVV